MIEFLNQNLQELLLYLLDPNKRLFIGYIVSAAILAIPVYWLTTKQKSVTGFFRFLVPKSIYLSQSAKQDYALLVLNKLLKAALFPLVIVTMAPVAMSVSSALEWIFQTTSYTQASSMAIMLCFTVMLFVFDDFTRFLLHYWLHKVPMLWEFHKVHHSAEVLTPFTIYRSHPVENYLYACRMAITQGAVVGICYFLFGPTLKMIDILGANLFVFAFNILGSNLRHSHIWLSFGDKIEGWLISPAQHQIHHSKHPSHYDVNLGTALAIWDRMANNLVKASSVKSLEVGLSASQADHSSLTKIYIEPFIRCYRKVADYLPRKRV